MSRLKLLGSNIKKYREEKGLSQAELAEKVNFSTEYICRVEKGQKSVSLRKLFMITDVLEVDFCKLTDFK